MIDARQAKSVVPIGPRAFVELTGFCLRQDFSKYRIAHLRGKCLNVRVVTDIHDLSNHALRHCDSFIWRFPPDVFAGKRLQRRLIDLDHDDIFSTHPYGLDD